MKIFPYIQEQYTDFTPLLHPVGGYAFFIDLLDFDKEKSIEGELEVGNEKVLLDHVIECETSVTLAQNGQSRSETAVSGSLISGDYNFKLKINEKVTLHKTSFNKNKLEPPVIFIKEEGNGILVSWESENSTSFWVFAIPDANYSSYSELFKKLKQMSENRYSKSCLKIEVNPFGRNISYRVIVRANTEERVNDIPRFSKEAWGISSVII